MFVEFTRFILQVLTVPILNVYDIIPMLNVSFHMSHYIEDKNMV